MTILSINQLSKHYGRIHAVDGLSLTVEEGNIFGILGPNGSGKTTTLGMILNIIFPDSGTYDWFEGRFGNNPRRHIGALLETPNFYPYLSALDNLKIVAHVRKLKNPDFDGILELVNLKGREHDLFRTYSFGMKQRLAIASAMLGDPDVLIFDEPTNGLDPQGIAEVRETILEIANRGKTILMASHILDEVEKICTHVAILKKGRLLATGQVGAILSDEQWIEVEATERNKLKALLANIPELKSVTEKDRFLLVTTQPDFQAATLNQLAFQQGILLTHLVSRSKSLESEFLEITKEDLV
ncbi:MAG: ATP-binding cassette domain-containing protein [Saprospirales bacterium]|nr:ATP-binding cassette domain-containing protein [Saprospirales bacterium]